MGVYLARRSDFRNADASTSCRITFIDWGPQAAPASAAGSDARTAAVGVMIAAERWRPRTAD